MKYIELFGGIGGFRHGLERADGDWECVAYYDNDEHAVESYNAIFGERNEPTDVREVDAGDVPDHNVLTAGFPCQSFSIAGGRGGFEDTRGTLFFEVARIAKRKLPEVLFLENVKGLLNHADGRTFRTIIETLHELGYEHVEWEVHNSKYFGIPQNRERVFIIGHRGGFPGRSVFPLDGTSGTDSRKDGAGERGLTYDRGSITLKDESNCIDKNYWKGIDNHGQRTMVVQRNQRDELCLKDESGAVHEHMRNNQAPKIAQIPRGKNEGGENETAPTVNASRFEQNNFIINHQFRPEDRPSLQEGQVGGSGILFNDEYVYTIDKRQPHYFSDGVRVRKLTPLECWRLQGFPDDSFKAAAEHNSDTQLYKQAGNAVTADVVEAIGSKIYDIYHES